MTAVRPVLDVYIDLNITLFLASMIWGFAKLVFKLKPLRFAYPAQLGILKALFICVLLSPFLAIATEMIAGNFWSGGSLAVSDLAVAAYLRGEIAIPATDFEALLNTRNRWIEGLTSGGFVAASLFLTTLALGAMLMAARAVRSATCIHQTIRDSFLWRRTARVDVRVSDRVTIPYAVRGILRRHVVLPSDLLSNPKELKFALAHEFQHLREGDVEWELAFEILRPVFFWNPAFLVFKHQFERLRELACDQSVIVRRDLDARDYSRCLLNICSRSISQDGPKVMNVALVNGSKAKNALRQRVLALHHVPSSVSSGHNAVLSMTFLFAIILAIGTASLKPSEDWSHDRLMLSTIVNLERLEAIRANSN